MNAALRLEFIEGIARILFDMPGSKANTLGQAILAEFETVLTQIEALSGLKGLILASGKPGMFIAGADLRELGSVTQNLEQTRGLIRRGLEIVRRFEELPFPTVALIDGACMGGGTELALGFDY